MSTAKSGGVKCGSSKRKTLFSCFHTPARCAHEGWCLLSLVPVPQRALKMLPSVFFSFFLLHVYQTWKQQEIKLSKASVPENKNSNILEISLAVTESKFLWQFRREVGAASEMTRALNRHESACFEATLYPWVLWSHSLIKCQIAFLPSQFGPSCFLGIDVTGQLWHRLSTFLSL